MFSSTEILQMLNGGFAHLGSFADEGGERGLPPGLLNDTGSGEG